MIPGPSSRREPSSAGASRGGAGGVSRRGGDEAGAAGKTPATGDHPSNRVGLVLAGILALGLLVRLGYFWDISGTAFPRIAPVSPQTDMFANWEWAQRILAGDWLGRDTYHPYFEWWMKRLAPLEVWHQWWGGKEIFQQAPLYPYLLAGLLALCGGSLPGVLVVQLLLGALQPLLMHRLATRLFDARAGLVAAALTALYGPFILHQGAHLRDWLPPLLEPLALLALLEARERGRGLTWAAAGAALGLALLAKETILLFLPLVLLWILLEYRQARREAGVAVAWVLAGLLLALSPLLARNVVVGAPAFAISNRAAEGIIEGNVADAFPLGMVIPASMRGILERSQGRLWPVIRETLGSYRGDWDRFLKLQLLKLRGVADPFEIPNNVSFYYGAELSPLLRASLGYGLVFPLGMAGLLLAMRGWRRHSLAMLYGLAALGGLMGGIILGRYRLVLVPVLILYAAALAVRIVVALRARKLGYAVGALGLILAWAFAQHVLLPLGEEKKDRIHALDYLASARVYAEEKRFDRAAAEMARLLDKARGSPLYAGLMPLYETDYRVFLAGQLIVRGEREAARHQLNLALKSHGRVREPIGYPHYNFGLLYLRLKEFENAKSAFARFLELEPDDPAANKARRLLLELEEPP